MSADPFKELDRLAGQAADEIAALRKEKASLEKRVETLSRDLKSRSEAVRTAEARGEAWAGERAELRRRVSTLVRRLETLS